MWPVVLVCMALVSATQGFMIRRVIIPHNAKPGFVVSTLTFWGQNFKLDNSVTGEVARFFSVLPYGDVITNSDISSLIGRRFPLVISNDLANSKWQESIHVEVQHSDHLLLFEKQEYEGHVLENQPPGIPVFGLEDVYAKIGMGNRKIHYSLESGSTKMFGLQKKENTVDHVGLTTKQSLDREDKSKYILMIKAYTDSGEDEPATAKATIYVDDENDNIPRFEKSHYVTTIKDNTPPLTTILRVKAVDPDDGKIKYVMEPHKLFEMDPERGEILLKTRKGLEAANYQLKVYAEDDGGLKSESAVIDVKVDVNGDEKLRFEPIESAHHIRSRRSTESRSVKEFEVPESRTGQLIRISSGLDRSRFSFKDPAPKKLDINQYNGYISLKDHARLDFENEQEINFTVVIATDKPSVVIEQPVKIKLTDVNDELPRFVNVPRPFLATVSQNAPPGTSVYQLMARDDDRDSTVQYALESGGEDRFEVDSESGVVRTRGNQPFRPGKEYEIGVSAQDVAAPTQQKSPTHSLRILVGERNPQFYETQYVSHVQEGVKVQDTIAEVKAYSHQGYPITYELMTDAGGSSNEFAINPNTGVIDLLRELDYEKDPQQYHLVVRATENGRPPRYSTVNLIINLVDINDNYPMFPLSQYIVQGIAETVPNGSHIIQVTATDLDSVTNSQLTYSVSNGNFTVESLNNIGYIKTARTLDFDHISDHTYNFTVTATDNGKPPLNGTAMVRVTVTNVNDEDPQFTKAIEHVQVSEDASPNTVVHVVQAYDPDGDDVTYSFAGERLTAGPFRIDPSSGIITLVGRLDKSKVSYKLNITATDNGRCCGGKTSRSNRGLVIVEVKDVNNNAPRFPDCSKYLPTVLERADVGTSVIQVTALDSDTGNNGNVTYSLVKSLDQDSDRFGIDPISGILETSEVFDREARTGHTDYGVTVKAEDQGSPRLAGFCTFRVHIGDVNDNPPVFDFPSYSTSLEEGSPLGKRVLQVYATDKDAGENGMVEYHMKEDPSGFFEINKHSGWITVERPMSGTERVSLIVEARDQGSDPISSTVEVDIEITQTVNAYPQWVQDYSEEPIKFSEGVPVNYIVKRLKAISAVPDGTVNYIIKPGETPEQNGSPQSFYHTINASTNEMLLKVYRALDYESIPRYTLTIKASNRATNSLHNATRMTIELIDKNDEIPQFVGLDENGRYPGSVSENVAPGAEVIAITATDRDMFPDYRKIAYSIKPYGIDYDKFAINPESGVITTRETFDREEKDEYYVTVIAQDGAPSNRPFHYPPGSPNQGEAEVQIRITDKNDNAPYFKQELYQASLPENTDMGAVVISVTAEDEDEENQLTYSITGGNVGNAFEVVPDLGQIKVRGNLDYEDGPREYHLTYRVFDDKFANTATVVVRITDVNDNPPRFEPAEYEVTDIVEEDPTVGATNPKFLVRVNAEDPDIDRRSNIRYSLTGQFADQGYFTINEVTGDIYVTKRLDRDKPSGRSVWNFNVLAHDEPGSGQSLTGYAIVQVKPKDINDNPPEFDGNRLVGRVLEHSRAGVSVLTVIATDVDKGHNGTVAYSLKQVPVKDGTALFAINPNTGLITTTMNNALDRETQPEFKIIVQARDQGTPDARSASATVTIHVQDINDHPPRFTQKVYHTTMSENYPVGASITSVSASDPDVGANAKMTYTLKEQDREYFYMSSVEATNTGVLKVFKPVDFDTLANPFFNLTVYVSDPDTTHLDMAYIEVEITDYNDNPPIFVPNSRKINIEEDVEVGSALATFSANDKDTGLNKQFSYAIDRDTDSRRQFSIDANGMVRVARPLDRETTPVHRVHILAMDKGEPAQTGTGTLIVTLKDVNDNHPVFAKEYHPVIYENEAEGLTVITISAVDKDTASNGPPFEFWLPCQGGCPCPKNPTCHDFGFKFIPGNGSRRGGGQNGQGSGIVTTKRTFDRERQKYFLMPIVMKDTGNPPVSGTNTLTIVVGDRNDNKHNPGHKNIFVYNYEGEFTNAPLGNAFAEDPDDWDRDDKAFTFVGNDASRFFNLDRLTGEISMKGQVREGDYNFQVHVHDNAWKRDVVSSITVKVREITDDAIHNSGSVRFSGITAEDFVQRPKIGPLITDYGMSKYDHFRKLVATKLGIPIYNVDIFTVMNHPTLPMTCDIRFAAHGSPYYRPARLNGMVNENKDEFENLLGIQILMVPIDECMEEKCESGGCSNRLVTSNQPLLVNTNGTSLVGVTAYVEADCQCAARVFEENNFCEPTSCLNGGTCRNRISDHYCECPPGFDGPRCQQTHHSFHGDGWAWYEPLAQCESSHTHFEFITTRENGLLLYHGPMRELEQSEKRDFMLLEMRLGYPVLRINHGTGEAKLTINGKDHRNSIRLGKLNDGKWHRIDIFRTGKRVSMVVDQCKSAVIYENENDQTSIEDREPCEATDDTPGENSYLNVNAPLQLGGRANPFITYPDNVLLQGFHGCIKNVVHNGEVYDLGIGRTGEHFNSQDGCPREEEICGYGTSDGPKCGYHGRCIATLEGDYECNCKPGYRGMTCDIPTSVKDFKERSYIEWDFKEGFYRQLEKRPFRTNLQLQFRTRTDSGLLFKVQNIQKSEYMILELKEKKVRFRYNLGSGENEIGLNQVNVSDGFWHTVYVERIGKMAVIKLDSGEGRYYNMSQGTIGGHLQILVARRQFYAGGDVKFPSSKDPAIVDYDYRSSCMQDIRYDSEWLPMDIAENSQSRAAELTRFENLKDHCNSSSCEQLACQAPRVCWDMWRQAECRHPELYSWYQVVSVCPIGQRWVPLHVECVNINECVERNPCVHGDCIDLQRGFKCKCHRGWQGDLCDVQQAAVAAFMSTGAIFAILICVLVLLLLIVLFIVYSRRRRPEALVVAMDPDDDVRENIIHYDEEGVGEEDQDAYDINRLKKPVDENAPKKPLIDEPIMAPKQKARRNFIPGEMTDVGDFITSRLDEADEDPSAPPHDSLHHFAYEGEGSIAGSLSSLASTTESEDQAYDYLKDWGPRFHKLADIYGGSGDDTL